MRKMFSACMAVTMLVSVFAATPYYARAYDQAGAQSYLLSHASNPWSTMALAASGAGSIPDDYLKSISGTSAIQYAAPILAITALDHDPRTFGPTDLVAQMKTYHTGGQLGDIASLNDDIFGILALRSAGEGIGDSVITDSKNFLLSHQNSDGGWGFTTSADSDTNMTATAILALTAAGVSASDAHITNGAAFLTAAQNDDGGFPYDPHSAFDTNSDTSSTAWVVWALHSLGTDPSSLIKSGDKTPLTFIESNQAAGGYFEYQHGFGEDSFSATTTAYAVIALGGKFPPVHSITLSGPGDDGGGTGGNSGFSFRIEGSGETICRGTVAAETALDIIKNAKNQCGYTYTIQDTSFGPYLTTINNDTAAGLIGWLYLVNDTSPSVGAADYELQPNDTVTWYYGDFNWKPARLSLSSATADSGGTVTATVEWLDDETWKPLDDADVFFGAGEVSADDSGHAAITAPDGFYQVFAEKDGYIRSNAAPLTVGEGSASVVGVKAHIIAGEVAGETIAFTVNPTTLDFGTVHSGESSEKALTITNTGTVNIAIGTDFSGDPVFGDNLSLDDETLETYQGAVAVGDHANPNAKLDIPSNYQTTTGDKTGQLTFWATAE